MLTIIAAGLAPYQDHLEGPARPGRRALGT